MKNNINTGDTAQIGFGGGCHWCTEAVFASLKGITAVEQGWIASQKPNDTFSEAVLLTYDASLVSLQDLILVHLATHAAYSQHKLRYKYRSAVYCLDEHTCKEVSAILDEVNKISQKPLITQVLKFVGFKANSEAYVNYYYSNPEKQFCQVHIKPKLDLIKERFAAMYK